MDKGTFSNLVSGLLFAVGLILPAGTAREFTLAIGMFAFSGGITNALAVKMLFDRIPGLVGSGVIPARFREIRVKMKELILRHFFDEENLRRFIARHRGDLDWRSFLKPGPAGRGPLVALVEEHWDRLTSPERLEPLIARQIEKLEESSVGGFIAMLGVGAVKPAVEGFVRSFAGSLKERLLEAAAGAERDGVLEVEIDEEKVAAAIRAKVDLLLADKLAELDPLTVKRMMEEVIRNHLGWLVVWGNVFGGVLGVAAFAIDRYS
jgi:uncharacterized membrane protein YheB (UPF0754 family)